MRGDPLQPCGHGPRFAQGLHGPTAVHAHDGLDAQQPADRGGGRGDAASFFQVGQGVHHGQQTGPLGQRLHLRGNLSGGHPLVPHSGRLLHQQGQGEGDGAGIHHMDLAALRHVPGDAGGLTGAAELGRDEDAHYLVPLVRITLEQLQKVVRVELGRGGQLLAGGQTAEELLPGDVHAVQEAFRAEEHPHGHDVDPQLRRPLGGQVAGAVGDDTYHESDNSSHSF